MNGTKDPYGRETGVTYTSETYVSERGNRITINRPVLPSEEYERRLREVERAAARLILATEERRKVWENS